MKVFIAHTLPFFLAGALHAGTITSAGTITDLTPPGFGTGTDVADFDTNQLGQEGFVLFNSVAEGTNISGQPWDLNIVDSKPAYISTLSSTAASSGGWANYDDVTVGGLNYNTGGIVLSPGGGTETELFRFTLGAGSPDDLRIGLIADNSDSPNWDATNVRVAQDGGGTADQDVVRNGGLDVVQFDLEGVSQGEVYIVYATSAPSGALLGGITFDLPPDLGSLSDPTSSDGDSIGDNWENFYFGDLTTANDTSNSDTDGLTDLEEWNSLLNNGLLISPVDEDTDDDTLADDAELNTHNTDPSDPDSDDDELLDAFEVNGQLNPNDPNGDNGTTGDPDGDTLNNLQEQAIGTLPNDDDTDDDGYLDGEETGTGFWTSPTSTGTNPLNDDTDGDGILDGNENPDLPFDPANPTTQPGSDPNLWDTDLDGTNDSNEANNGTDPTDAGSAPSGSPDVLSVDFQGIPGVFPSLPILMQGGTQISNYFSGTWNALDITGHDGTTIDPSWSGLVNAQDTPTNVGFNVTGTISSWTNTPSDRPIFDDYMFVNAGNAGASMTWQITGLAPNSSYRFFPFGGVVRDFSITVDTNGDGDLADETPTLIPPVSGVEFTVISDATGVINGSMDPGNSGEANWGGFELMGALPGVTGTGVAIQAIDYDGEDVFLTWTSTPGASYTIETSTNLEPDSWTAIFTDLNAAAAPATTTTQLVDSPVDSAKYYRVIRQ
ncbi:MAG: hypothetical protein PVJ98_10425 [Akkermansiaceae bacterium]|jgi:hypothetical protein